MKKLSRIAALLAAGALLFGAAGCSGGGSGSGDGDGDGSGGGGGGGSTVSENTVKGTYTVKDADLAGETLVFVGGKIYMRMDYSLGEEEEEESSGGSSAPDSTTQSNGKYTLTYESGETAHEPSYTFDKVGGDEFVADLMAAIGAGKTSYTFYLEVGTYAIANGKVTGTIIDDEDSYPVTAETDDAGHLKSFTGSSGGGGTVDAVWDFNEGANASTNATIIAFGGSPTALSSPLEIQPDSGSGATLTLLVNSNNKIKYSANKSGESGKSGGGIQQNTGSLERDFADLKVDAACTVTIKAAGASSAISTGNINSFSINGTNKFKAEPGSEDTTEHEYTYTATGAETIKITATGMKFMSITCK